jgi:glycosyltransferase involved in cell wall biosynthesis
LIIDSENGSGPKFFTEAEMARIARFAGGRNCEIARRASATVVVLSIVVPNYNTERFIGNAIQSALKQTFRDLELIVVDDGSTDGSVARILTFDDPRLTVITQQNHGLAGTRNLGIAMSRGRYIGFLDSDDIWFPQKAMKHIRLMDEVPEIGFTFSWSEYLTEAGDRTGQLLISRCNQPTARQLALRNHIGNGSTPVVRADCLDQVGGFREDIPGVEDWDLWVRIALNGNCQCRLIPEVLTGYRVRSGSISFTFEGANNFISSGTNAVRKFESYRIPDYSASDSHRSIAELYRICSRKAFTAGQKAASRKLLWKAFKQNPALFVRDFRAVALLGLLLLPEAITRFAIDAAYRTLRTVAAIVGSK